MSVVAKVGERTYEFQSKDDLRMAQRIYTETCRDQNGFEELMEQEGIDFLIEE